MVRRRRPLVSALKSVLVVLSTLVVAVAAYAWVYFSELERGTSTSNLKAAPPDGATDILLVGMDSRTDAQGHPLPPEVLSQLRAGDNEANMTDTLILVHIPNNGQPPVAFSMPRDAYVSIPGHGMHKINSAFGRGKSEAVSALQQQGVTDPAEIDRRASEAGRQLMLATVAQLTGVGIDHYAEVNLLGFYQLTNAIGGVPVCLRTPVHDSYSGASFRAGPQKVAGTDALAFVRQRHGLPRGDLDRVVRQQAFLAGLSRTMTSTGVLASPTKLSGLIQSVNQSIVLDKGWDVLAFASKMRGMAGGSTTFSTIPIRSEDYPTTDGSAVKVDPEQVQRTVHSQMGTAAGARPPRFGPKPTVQLDGLQARKPAQGDEDSDGPSGTPQQPTITANGVPCVN